MSTNGRHPSAGTRRNRVSITQQESSDIVNLRQKIAERSAGPVCISTSPLVYLHFCVLPNGGERLPPWRITNPVCSRRCGSETPGTERLCSHFVCSAWVLAPVLPHLHHLPSPHVLHSPSLTRANWSARCRAPRTSPTDGPSLNYLNLCGFYEKRLFLRNQQLP